MITNSNRHLLTELTKEVSVTRLCEILKISRSTYYRAINQPILEPTNLEKLIRDTCVKTKFKYGYRKIHALVNKTISCGLNKVRRIMRRQGWNCRVKPKRFKRSVNPFQLFDNLVAGNWTSTSPRKLLTTDITYLPFGSSTQYLCSIIDTFNNEVIAYKISNHPNAKLCVDTLEQLTDLAEDCILHSDQGSTFASEIYFECCRKKSITRSMSRLGTYSDNAIIESFHSSLKSETFYYMENQQFSNIIVQNIVREFISDWNESRILTKLGNLSPVQYRELMA